MTVGIRWSPFALGKEDGFVRRAGLDGLERLRESRIKGNVIWIGPPRRPLICWTSCCVADAQRNIMADHERHLYKHTRRLADLPSVKAHDVGNPVRFPSKACTFLVGPILGLAARRPSAMMLIHHIDQHHCHHRSQDQHRRKAVSAARCRYEHW